MIKKTSPILCKGYLWVVSSSLTPAKASCAVQCSSQACPQAEVACGIESSKEMQIVSPGFASTGLLARDEGDGWGPGSAQRPLGTTHRDELWAGAS